MRRDDALMALLGAAERGDVTAVSSVLEEQPALIDERGVLPGHSGRRTALHFGIRHANVVRALLERGANPNIRDDGDHAYPLHFAAERGDLDVVRLLVEHGADTVGEGTTHGLDVLGWAVCFEGATHADVARYLIDHGTPYSLLTAVALGEAEEVARLLREGADVNQRMDQTNHRRTPLHLAVVKQRPSAVLALLNGGADATREDAVGLTPLDHAALRGNAEIAALLLSRGAAMTLPAAIALGERQAVDRMLQADPEALSTTNNRFWARLLVYASSHSSPAVVDSLLRVLTRHRAGLTIVNMEDDQETAVDGAGGYTPLHAAAFHGNGPVVALLLQHGANPRARDRKYGGTPAGWARYASHVDVVQQLLQADIDVFDAIDADDAAKVEELLERDPDALDRPFGAYVTCNTNEVTWRPTPDMTPTQWAARAGREHTLRVLTARAAGRTAAHGERTQRLAWFLESACWDHHVHGRALHRMHDRAAARLLEADPSIATENLYTAIVCGELETVTDLLLKKPALARERGGPRSWTPMLYLTYARFSHPATQRHAVTIAQRLLEHGADPNDFYMAGDARYSALTGVAAEGEQDAPGQPYAADLFRLLLARGAEPFDVQVLYNTHFRGDILWWLDIVHRATVGTAREDAWRDPEWSMLDMGAYGSGARFLLELGIKKHDVRLVEWLLARGANPNAAPARDPRFPKHSLYELAMIEEQPDIAERLVEAGALPGTPILNDRERLLRAARLLDRHAIQEWRAAKGAGDDESFLILDAAKRDRPDALRLLMECGISPNIRDAAGKRPLHEAAYANAAKAAEALIASGAEIDPRDYTHQATPLSWASYVDHPAMLDLLAPHSRDIWTLSWRGYVDRVRELLSEQPELAHARHPNNTTPLSWLPDDEAAAQEIVTLLLAAGADPTVRNESGHTPAWSARRRGMSQIAARLDG